MSGPIQLAPDAQLRRLTPDDAAALCALVARNKARLDSLGMRDWGEALHSVEATRAYIQTLARFYAETRGLVAGIWARGALLGMAGHNRLDVAGRCVEVGAWLDSAHEGRGLATRACRALTSYAFSELHLSQVTIRCREDNDASHTVAERLGFIQGENEMELVPASGGGAIVTMWNIYTMQAEAWAERTRA